MNDLDVVCLLKRAEDIITLEKAIDIIASRKHKTLQDKQFCNDCNEKISIFRDLQNNIIRSKVKKYEK